uniref:Dual specificity phosphatase catalytic domain-containing protein n=1 Tax=Caenorhabditis japonica TaxID=281687 RepID=A0A8R1IRP2_CAEJA
MHGLKLQAGRTRSATVATCYLMKSRNWMSNVAWEFLRDKRHQVILRNAHWRTVNEYRRFLDQNSVSSRSGSPSTL